MVFLMVDVAVACEEDVMYQQEPELPLPLPGGSAIWYSKLPGLQVSISGTYETHL